MIVNMANTIFYMPAVAFLKRTFGVEFSEVLLMNTLYRLEKDDPPVEIGGVIMTQALLANKMANAGYQDLRQRIMYSDGEELQHDEVYVLGDDLEPGSIGDVESFQYVTDTL